MLSIPSISSICCYFSRTINSIIPLQISPYYYSKTQERVLKFEEIDEFTLIRHPDEPIVSENELSNEDIAEDQEASEYLASPFFLGDIDDEIRATDLLDKKIPLSIKRILDRINQLDLQELLESHQETISENQAISRQQFQNLSQNEKELLKENIDQLPKTRRDYFQKKIMHQNQEPLSALQKI